MRFGATSMPETSSANMLVYRDGRRRVLASELVRQLERALDNLRSGSTEDSLLNALLRAGELECALSDAQCPGVESATALTDELASMACRAGPRLGASLRACQQYVRAIHDRGELTVSRPEGFAYYALHPLDFADTVSSVHLNARCAYVVGIRSIGTTLSAVVAAKLNADGIPATRTTVRPEGHPYDRRTAFTDAQRNAFQQDISRRAIFLVCDEGPGRSGSSLLSVAEALEKEGVSHDCILLLCSHQPNPDALCAPDAANRWRRYRSLALGMTSRLPKQAGDYLGADEWRRLFIPPDGDWPPAWPQTERLKFLSRDRQRVFKFQGHGPYGQQVREREQLLASSGFGPAYLGHQAGFGMQEVVGGKQPAACEPSLAMLTHVARYCACRATTFSAAVSPDSIRQLEHMAAFNLEQEFGFAPELHLEVEQPAICDGRMQHHEWRELGNNDWVKLDASTHGDDHFFPGPTDIAWDLAGFCVEWQLSVDARDSFLAEYWRLSGDNAAARLQPYEVAYAAFRRGWSRMAAASVAGTHDEGRLLQDAARYRALLDRILVAHTPRH